MFLTVHSAAGLVASQYIANPILAFIIGFILHYFFDIIPHGDSKIPKRYWNVVYITFAGIIDILVLTIFVTLLMVKTGQILTITKAMAILGSILPDCLQFIYFLLPKNQLLKKINKFHNYFHDLLYPKFEIGLIPGIILQIIIFSFLTLSLI